MKKARFDVKQAFFDEVAAIISRLEPGTTSP